ncbi:MAG: HAMP domain-containing histidine kinase [Bacteroidales bacterium]|nr:HAMP domain-containing histidine kinase [Bacteroidales bacterium]NPV36013.1 HAMP domain-containing histidine kinase [Bacteroidales bacterium]
MNRKIIRFVIILSALSLVGVVFLQYFWFRKMYELQEQQFDRDVMASIGETARRLERDQTLLFLSDRMHMLSMADTLLSSPALKQNKNNVEDTFIRKKRRNPAIVKYRKQLIRGQGGNSHVVVYSEFTDTLMGNNHGEKELIDEFTLPFPSDPYYEEIIRRQQEFFQQQFGDLIDFFPEGFFNPAQPAIRSRIFHRKQEERQHHIDRIRQLEKQTAWLTDALNRLTLEIKSLDNATRARLNIPATPEILSRELHAHGIDLPFEYTIVGRPGDTLAQSPNFGRYQTTKVYEAPLFMDRFLSTNDRLLLYFPTRQAHLLKNIGWMVFASAAFTLFIVVTFVVSIFVILRQKKISDIKSDFINNMTHEFKTPIATISLAADSLVNPRIINDPEKILYYIKVIKEENKRMNTQVESVLRMALLEKKDFGLNLQPLDVHDLINQAIQNISIQVEKRGGKIISRLEAENSVARVDEIHFLNVMFNLLDNANKYSPDTPEIEVSTRNKLRSLMISVKDHGMGMDRETRSRAFEKFYRKSTGNIHNVKGFGLGLAYVKAIVTATGGDIRIESEPGKGSEFIIELPQKTDEHE